MSEDDTRQQQTGANFVDNAGSKASHSGKFEQNFQTANLSPEARKQYDLISELGRDRLDAERKSQQRAHEFRVLRLERDKLIEYVRDQRERPAEIVADPTPDLEIIRQEAERQVSEREQFYLRNIQREIEANLEQIVERDRKGLVAEPSVGHQQDYELGHD